MPKRSEFTKEAGSPLGAGNQSLVRHLLAKCAESIAMSSIPVKNSQPIAFPPRLSIERRSKLRFPIELRVTYRTLGRSFPCAGEGWVANISAGGVLVSSQHEIDVGARMELNIEWPSLLHGRIPLRFVAVGEVVRCDASSFAVMMARHSFRTAKRKVTSIEGSAASAGN